MTQLTDVLPDAFLLLAGEDNLRAQRTQERALMDAGYSLPQAQEREQSGVIGINLVRSIYGWSVRYSSGLQNFGLIRPSRLPDSHGPRPFVEEFADYLEARAYAIEWSRSYKGYAYVSRGDLERFGVLQAAEAVERAVLRERQ
jgi:hypothetical protein